MTIDIQKYKAKLIEEKDTIESELQSVGVKSNTNVSDWDPTLTEAGESQADRTEVADAIENYEENTAMVSELETRLLEINNALSIIDTDDYAKCAVCGNQIEENRLDANPAAKTCIAHL